MTHANTHGADTASGVGTLVYLTIGPILWALHLAVVYGLQPVLCRYSVEVNLAVVGIATVTALVVLLGAVARPKVLARLLHARAPSQASRRFHRRVMRWAALLSAAGIIWAGAAALVVPACEGLR
jgi:hypothetical protein